MRNMAIRMDGWMDKEGKDYCIFLPFSRLFYTTNIYYSMTRENTEANIVIDSIEKSMLSSLKHR